MASQLLGQLGYFRSFPHAELATTVPNNLYATLYTSLHLSSQTAKSWLTTRDEAQFVLVFHTADFWVVVMTTTDREDRSGSPSASSIQVERRHTHRAESGPELLSERIRSQFAPMYLTLGSIVQGAVLTTLVARVEGTYGSFTAVDWILTATTFMALIAIWHEYLMQVLAYVWLPTYLDSLIPFGFLVAELFMAHFVYHDLRAWLWAYAGFYLMGVVGWHYQNRQIVTLGDAESRKLDRLFQPMDWIRGAMLLAFMLLSLLAAGLYDALRLGQVQLSVALGAAATIVIFKVRAIPAWNRLIAYATQDGSQTAE